MIKHFLLQHSLEIPATLFGLLNVYLAAKNNVWNFLFGALSIFLYIFIFFHAKLYADMSLYFIFLALQFYGAYEWLYGGEKHSVLKVSYANKKIYSFAVIIIFLLFISIAYILKNYTDSTTVYMDAFTTAVSLVAQWMMSEKWLENWGLWILVDVIAIRMYLVKQLYLTAGLYGIFLGICVLGFYQWKKLFTESTP